MRQDVLATAATGIAVRLSAERQTVLAPVLALRQTMSALPADTVAVADISTAIASGIEDVALRMAGPSQDARGCRLRWRRFNRRSAPRTGAGGQAGAVPTAQSTAAHNAMKSRTRALRSLRSDRSDRFMAIPPCGRGHQTPKPRARLRKASQAVERMRDGVRVFRTPSGRQAQATGCRTIGAAGCSHGSSQWSSSRKANSAIRYTTEYWNVRIAKNSSGGSSRRHAYQRNTAPSTSAPPR